LGGLVVLYWFPPEQYPFYPPCPTYSLLGWHCAGCGSTRAVHSLLRGDLSQALAYNALLVLALPVLFPVGIVAAFAALRGKPPPWRKLPAWLFVSLLVVLLLYTVLRNLPYPPFDALAPHRLG
jgi:hypothetical protein